jgi:hypothetical protein
MGRHTVNTQTLETTVRIIFVDGQGLLAIDESTETCNERFANGAFRRPRKLTGRTANRSCSVDLSARSRGFRQF